MTDGSTGSAAFSFEISSQPKLPTPVTGPSLPPPALNVQVTVDTKACSTGLVQCSAEGHSFDAASSRNHNPIGLTIFVLDGNGQPVPGLELGDFKVVRG